MAQTSVVGSLFANALLVLGLVIIVGARRDGIMRFRARLPQDTADAAALRLVRDRARALAVASHDEASRHVDTLSAVAAVALLAIYGAWLWSYLRADEPREEADESRAQRRCRSRSASRCWRWPASARRSPRTGS